jgi:hypothetical protein
VVVICSFFNTPRMGKTLTVFNSMSVIRLACHAANNNRKPSRKDEVPYQKTWCPINTAKLFSPCKHGTLNANVYLPKLGLLEISGKNQN